MYILELLVVTDCYVRATTMHLANMHVSAKSNWILRHTAELDDVENERDLPKPEYVELSDCPCDVTHDGCDVDCCCDSVRRHRSPRNQQFLSPCICISF